MEEKPKNLIDFKKKQTVPVGVEIMEPVQNPEFRLAQAKGQVEALITMIDIDFFRGLKKDSKKKLLDSLKTLKTCLEGGKEEEAFQNALPIEPE